MAETTPATPRAPRAQQQPKPRATTRGSAGLLANLKTWATMYDDILSKTGGTQPGEFNQGQRDILKDVLAKLETAK